VKVNCSKAKGNVRPNAAAFLIFTIAGYC